MSLLKNRPTKHRLLEFYYSSLHPVCIYARLADVFVCLPFLGKRVFCPRPLSEYDKDFLRILEIHETVHVLQYGDGKLKKLIGYLSNRQRARYEGEAYFAEYYIADDKLKAIERARYYLNSWRYLWCGSEIFEQYVAAYNSEQIVPDRVLRAIELLNKERKQNA